MPRHMRICGFKKQNAYLVKVDIKTIGLLLVGGHHHILHLIPIASELHKLNGLRVIIFVSNEVEKNLCAQALHELGMKNPDIRIGGTNKICNRISSKLTFLLCNLGIWNKLDAIITVERTSTILRYFSKNLPPMIHIPAWGG